MYCRGVIPSFCLSLLLGRVGRLGRTHAMHLSLWLLVIDVIDFLTILDINIYHNPSDFFNLPDK